MLSNSQMTPLGISKTIQLVNWEEETKKLDEQENA